MRRAHVSQSFPNIPMRARSWLPDGGGVAMTGSSVPMRQDGQPGTRLLQQSGPRPAARVQAYLQRSVARAAVWWLTMTVLAACSRTVPTPVSAVTTPAPPVSSHGEPTATEIFELREKCARDAREWFTQNTVVPEPIPVQGGGGIDRTPAS